MLSYKDNIFTLSSDSSYVSALFTYQKNMLNGYVKPKHLMIYKYIDGAIYTINLTMVLSLYQTTAYI